MLALAVGTYDSSWPIVFALAALVWLVGLIVFAAPLWALMHGRGMRRLSHAIIIGSALGFVASLGFQTEGFGMLSEQAAGYSSEFGDGHGIFEKDGVTTGYGWWVAAKGSAVVALASAIAAAVIWRVAYHRKPSA